VVNTAIHRAVEAHAAASPGAVAIASSRRTVTYREVNCRANALARRLVQTGLKRGATAIVRMEPSEDLIVVLLAILKAGAAYAWVKPGSPHDAIDLPASFCIMRGHSTREIGYLAVDIRGAVAASAAAPASPNLPIHTRGSDIACVLLDRHGAPQVLVPHAAVTALAGSAGVLPCPRTRTATLVEIWLALITGTSAAIVEAPATHTSVAA